MTIEAAGKQIDIFRADSAGPLVLVITDHGEAEEIVRACEALGCADFALAGIRGVDWDRELSPWAAPAVFKGGADFGGEAAQFYRALKDEILPALAELSEGSAGVSPPAEGPTAVRPAVLCGYSLAGLFAVYAGLMPDCPFAGIVSASGSLWYPGIVPFMQEALRRRGTGAAGTGTALGQASRLRAVYCSVGDREAKTRNKTMQSVEANTREAAQLLAAAGLVTTFELNPGGHFLDDAQRQAKGICWALRHSGARP